MIGIFEDEDSIAFTREFKSSKLVLIRSKSSFFMALPIEIASDEIDVKAMIKTYPMMLLPRFSSELASGVNMSLSTTKPHLILSSSDAEE